MAVQIVYTEFAFPLHVTQLHDVHRMNTNMTDHVCLSVRPAVWIWMKYVL